MSDLKSKHPDTVRYLFLFIIAAAAVFIRVYRFGAIPGGMNQDGALAAIDAKALAAYGTDRLGMRFPVHLTAWGFGQMSALLSYMQTVPIKLFGMTPFSSRLPQLLVSLASLAVLYLLAKEIFSPGAALTVFFIAALNPWHITQSRWALDCNLFPHFLLAGVYLLEKGIKKHDRKIYLSMVMFALSMYCYGIAIYTVPVFLFASCIYLLIRKKIRFPQALLCAFVYLAVAWPFIVCMVINTFSLDTIETPFFTIPYFEYSMRSKDILFFSADPLKQLKLNLHYLLIILMQKYDGLLCNEVPGFGTMYVFSIPFMLIGLYIILRQSRKNTGCALIVIWFFTALFSGIITAGVNINRINIIFYPLIFFCGAGVYKVITLLRKFPVCALLSPVLPAAYVIAFLLFSHTYFTDYSVRIADAFMQDFGAAVTSLKNSDADVLYISPDAQYKGYWYVSEVLTLFYHDIDARYYRTPDYYSRYKYSLPESPDPRENAAYVAAYSDLSAFPAEYFNIVPYGKFYTVTPIR